MKQRSNIWQLYTTQSDEQTAHQTNASLTNGLSIQEAHRRLMHDGVNELPSHTRSLLSIFLDQFLTIPSIALLAIGLFYLSMQKYTEALVVAIISLINIFLGVIQEYRADRSLYMLKEYLSHPVAVIRAGQEIFIPTRTLVVGDIVTLRPGDIVPADIRIIKMHACLIDESVITGESLPVHKQCTALKEQPTTIFAAHNIAFAGTEIVGGMMTGIVIATGINTGWGELQVQSTNIIRASTFSEEMPHISWMIGILILISITLITSAHILFGGISVENIRHIGILAAALVVTIIPETLPLIITCSLSEGALRLAKKGAVIVKRLSAIADLGHMNILCTDKTGTLTEHILSVAEITADDPLRTLTFARLAGASPNVSATSLRGFDHAIEVYVTQELRQQMQQYHRLAESPFDPQSRSNMTAVTDGSNKLVILLGAPEYVVSRCAIAASVQDDIIHKAAQAGKRGERVISVATRLYTNTEAESETIDVQIPLERYEGMISFTDPLKKSAAAALEIAQKLNVRIKILSGDSVEVCAYIAQQLGIIHKETEVMTGEEWIQLTPDAQQKAATETSVFARCLPQYKAALVQCFKTMGSVGYMGDGINDTLALRQAHVAIAVQNAPRITYEAADIIVMHKSLLNIVNAIAAGRTMMHNLLSYLRISLSANLGNFYSISIAALFFDFPPDFPLHMLIVNLLSDIPLIAIATDHVHQQDLQLPSRFERNSFLKEIVLLGFLNSSCDLIFLFFFYQATSAVLGTAWVTWSALGELVLIFSLRSRRFFWQSSRPSWQLVSLSLFTMLLVIGLPASSWGKQTLKYTALSIHNYMLIGISVCCCFIIFELCKPFILTDQKDVTKARA